ncbi:IS6 family transposase [Candidatus Jidaibacter acanthamoebae]|nr:IS6 family transposase [Candidatus Jidaibacter acanthamoeba]
MLKYKGYRFPVEIISYVVWCYYRLAVSLRDIESLLMYKGVEVSHETIRSWVMRFGRIYANNLKRREGTRGDKWHLDEQCIVIRGKRY